MLDCQVEGKNKGTGGAELEGDGMMVFIVCFVKVVHE